MSTADGTEKPLDSSSTVLDPRQQAILRLRMKNNSEKVFGIPYDIEPGPPVEWTGRGKCMDITKSPKSFDCSGLAAYLCHLVGLKMPDGAQAQFNFTVGTQTPTMGDFAFFGHGGDITKIYHVGMVYDDLLMVEARAFDKNAKFETGKVIVRPRVVWERYLPSFVGYRSHPKLV